MTQRRSWMPVCWIAAMAMGGVAACDPEPEPESENLEDALADYCEESGECGDGKQDLVGAIVATKVLWDVLSDLVKRSVSFDWIEDNFCAMPHRFGHFVDYASRDVDGRPSFTSVQDFEIERTDLEARDVLAVFEDDWLLWWDNGGTTESTMTDEGPALWHQEIRPIKLPAVNIVMDVHELDPVKHPPLRDPDRDRSQGHAQKWDAGLEVGMSGNAFKGTMVVLARKTSRGIAVREIWFNTEPVSPLVMKVVPAVFDLTDEETLAIPPALHILATEGCVPTAKNSGYPGLIEKFEAGDLP